MLDAFRGHAVLITGASRGIGRSMTRQLADAGARLALMARPSPDLHEAVDACRAAGGDAAAFPGDVAVETDCVRVIEDAAAYLGGLDMLILNAGISMLAPFDEVSDLAPLERVMQVNYFGAVYCTRYALPALRESHGRIVAVSSLTGLTGVPTRTGYAASKHAMRGFFDSLRIEIERHGVSVTVAYPGFVDTGIRERAVGRGLGRPLRTHGRVMSADQCARLILEGAARRRRDIVMTAKGKAGRWLKLVAPAVVDRIASRAAGFHDSA